MYNNGESANILKTGYARYGITYRQCQHLKNQIHDIFNLFAGIIHVGK